MFPISASIASSSDAIDQQMMALINQLGDELQEQHSWTAQQTENVITTEVAVSTTGDLTEGSAVITNIPATSALEATTWVVTGTGLVPSARIVSVDSATQITMSEEATDTQAGVALLFAKDTYAIPVDFQSYVSTTWWDRSNRWELLGPTSPQMDQALRSGIVTTSPRRNWRQVGGFLAPGASGHRLVRTTRRLRWSMNTTRFTGPPIISAPRVLGWSRTSIPTSFPIG